MRDNVYRFSRTNEPTIEALDIGYCLVVLHHLYDPGKAIKEMTRTLKPGGQLIIGDFGSHNYNLNPVKCSSSKVNLNHVLLYKRFQFKNPFAFFTWEKNLSPNFISK
ncbi:class I SAM-dependent methyltransferase [Desulfitobacterium chlororespirans]|uniref:class I SAM-dependent methyltransferase n=1 Tax=Desulfitobacterium chlororespirans TaxID=51616 RepID=UPI00249EA06C|nr:methyltransferase domain-containing protein [Desulfitobacterium chlororespirans]